MAAGYLSVGGADVDDHRPASAWRLPVRGEGQGKGRRGKGIHGVHANKWYKKVDRRFDDKYVFYASKTTKMIDRFYSVHK